MADGEHEFNIAGFSDLLEANSLDYIQFDTGRVAGIRQALKISVLVESYQVPVVPQAGQMHNYHVVMASLNSPMADFFPKVDVEVATKSSGISLTASRCPPTATATSMRTRQVSV